MSLYITGHKSPDTDSVASSIALAYLLTREGREAVAVKTGELNQETKSVLQRFGFEDKEPILIDAIDSGKVILVDHNEKEHRIEGDFEILEIWDHHRFNFSSKEPIFIRCEPVGSTASILTKEFLQRGIEIPKDIAGLLLSAILSDTVIFKSSTTTEFDKEMAKKLNENLGFDLEKFGLEIKRSGTKLDEPIKDLILRDFKEYNFSGKKTGIGQLELIEIEDFLEKRGEILEKMEAIKRERNYDSLIFFVTDIIKEGSEFFCIGEEEKIERIFNKKLQKNSFWVEGLISRKKQVVPLLER